MEQTLESYVQFFELSGWLAPLLFILIHILRQIFFVPVIVVCILGGYLFGMFYGTLYSIIGLTMMSVMFYGGATKFPKVLDKLTILKSKWFGNYRSLNMTQIMLLRLLPFVHFHLISLYLLEMANTFKQFVRYSFFASIPPALLFTSFGHIIHELPLTYAVFIILPILIVVHYYGKHQKNAYKWSEFFTAKT